MEANTVMSLQSRTLLILQRLVRPHAGIRRHHPNLREYIGWTNKRDRHGAHTSSAAVDRALFFAIPIGGKAAATGGIGRNHARSAGEDWSRSCCGQPWTNGSM